MNPYSPGTRNGSRLAKSVLDRPTSFVRLLDLSVDPYLSEVPSTILGISESLEPDPDLLISFSHEPSCAESTTSELASGRNLLLACLDNRIYSTDDYSECDTSMARDCTKDDSALYLSRSNRLQNDVGDLLSPVTPKHFPYVPQQTCIRVQSDDVYTKSSTQKSNDIEPDSVFRRKSSTPTTPLVDDSKSPSQRLNFGLKSRRSLQRSKFFQSQRGKPPEMRENVIEPENSKFEKDSFSSFPKRESSRISHIFGLSRRPRDTSIHKPRPPKPTVFRLSSVFERVASRSPRLIGRICKMFVHELPIPSIVAKTKIQSVLEKYYNANVEDRDHILIAKLVLNLTHETALVNVTIVIESRGPVSCIYIRRFQGENLHVTTEDFENFCNELCSNVANPK